MESKAMEQLIVRSIKFGEALGRGDVDAAESIMGITRHRGPAKPAKLTDLEMARRLAIVIAKTRSHLAGCQSREAAAKAVYMDKLLAQHPEVWDFADGVAIELEKA